MGTCRIGHPKTWNRRVNSLPTTLQIPATAPHRTTVTLEAADVGPGVTSRRRDLMNCARRRRGCRAPSSARVVRAERGQNSPRVPSLRRSAPRCANSAKGNFAVLVHHLRITTILKYFSDLTSLHYSKPLRLRWLTGHYFGAHTDTQFWGQKAAVFKSTRLSAPSLRATLSTARAPSSRRALSPSP